jgi:hypothetical protein
VISVPVALIFALQVSSRVMIDEDHLATVATVAPERLPSDYLPGRIVLLAPGQPVAILQDDLDFLAMQCLMGIPTLVSGASVSLIFSDDPGSFELTVDGDTVRVSGDLPSPFEAPAAEFLPALLDCCRRFVAFARTTLGDRPKVQERIDQLDPLLAEATAALGTLGKSS